MKSRLNVNDVLVNYSGELGVRACVMMHWCESSEHERRKDVPVNHETRYHGALRGTSVAGLMYARGDGRVYA